MSFNDRHILHRFDSVPELVAAVQAGSDPHGSSHEFGSTFSGTQNFDQAVQYALQGWTDARPGVEAILEPVREKLAEKLDDVHERMHDIIGVEPDIDRYLDGELECMYEDIVIPAPTKGKVFTLLVSTSVLGSVGADLVFKRGAAIVALVEAFQMLGCDLTIYVENTCRGSGPWAPRGDVYSVLTKVHSAGDNLDINNLMFPLGHPAWQRRIIFGQRECNGPTFRGRWGFTSGGGMGATVAPVCDDIIDASFVLAQQPHRRSDEIMDPVQWVLDQLEVQGVYNPDDEDLLPGAGQ